jgi:prepilin-type N-terminal cleavage/methylation domain-containing protein
MTHEDDDGVTLIELTVSMMIMSVMMTMFTTAALQMYRAANKSESVAAAQTDLNVVFLRLDKIVRYASWISDPQQTGDRHDIRMLTITSSDGQRCHGLKVTGGTASRLLILAWNPDDLDDRPTAAQYASDSGSWTTLANNVGAPTGEKPFERVPADSVQNFDRLQLRLEATKGTNESRTKSDTNVRFTALNSSLARSSTDLCPLK